MKKINIFKKKIPILAILAVLVIGIASAAIFTHYATLTGTIEVNQAISVNGEPGVDIKIPYSDSVLGDTDETTSYTFTIENSYTKPIPVVVTSSVDCPGELIIEPSVDENNNLIILPESSTSVTVTYDPDSNVNGICNITTTVSPYMEGYMSHVQLSSKDTSGSWTITDDMKANVYFIPSSNEFQYVISATGLLSDTQYALIYYADKPGRFDNWGGDNPGAVITTFTATEGTTLITGSVELDMNLPSPPDTNIDIYSYCDNEYGDNYENCHGAKLWIVLAADLIDGELPVSLWANAGSYLFETDLIQYTDTDIT